MLDDRTISEYLRRSYFAVDGLWFMKVEETLGFDEALRLDTVVWAILGKIQARKARELLNIEGRGVKDLVGALQLKWAAEQYTPRVAAEGNHRVEVEITACPWIELLRKSGREDVAARVADAICTTEYAAWAREFDPAIRVSFPERICDGCAACRLILETG
jgi:predicted ArsR family transcriptional regulator